MKDFNVRQQCLPGVRDKENSGRETLGKFFYDLAKITFTALVAGNLVSLSVLGEMEYWILLAIGVISTSLLSFIMALGNVFCCNMRHLHRYHNMDVYQEGKEMA